MLYEEYIHLPMLKQVDYCPVHQTLPARHMHVSVGAQQARLTGPLQTHASCYTWC